MKKFGFFLSSLAFLFIWSCSERSSDQMMNTPPDSGFTQLKGKLNGILSIAKSPYQVSDTIFVDSAASLNIQKGVKLHFTDSAMFIIYGKVEAVGDSNRVISFTAYRNNWKGIRVVNSHQNSIFQFCLIEKVYSDWQDSSQFGALEINNSTATIQNCIFRENNCYNGGGLSLLNDSSLITNNIIRENEAVVFGGGIFTLESSARIINNTIYHNYCTNVGGGLVLYNPVAMDIQNNIFFNNAAGTGDPRIWLVLGDSSGFSQQYNFLPIGNQDPYFISNENLHLRNYSVCIDAGNPDPVFNDADGSRNDQGAFGGPEGDW